MRLVRLGVLALACAAPARGAEIWTNGSARLRVGGEFSGTVAPEDRGYFNDTDYGQNLLRQVRLGLNLELAASPRLALLAEARAENMEHPRVYALYLRARPWADRHFDLQAGLIPTVFGRSSRSGYGADSPLVGDPLAYQYLTTMRSNAVPPGAAGLLAVRGNGWLVGYGNAWGYESGLPLVAGRRWDTGVQARVGGEPLQASVAVTQGTLSRPHVRDDNSGKQVSARVAWRPVPSLALGASAARGQYLDRAAQAALPEAARGRTFRQRALGADLECASGHWLLRAEAVYTEWDAAALTAPLLGDTLTALAWSVEARRALLPGLHVGARFERLTFGDIEGPTGPASWEAPVRRLEAGVSYAVTRQVKVKVAYQRNRRDGGFVRANDLVAVQGALWF